MGSENWFSSLFKHLVNNAIKKEIHEEDKLLVDNSNFIFYTKLLDTVNKEISYLACLKNHHYSDIDDFVDDLRRSFQDIVAVVTRHAKHVLDLHEYECDAGELDYNGEEYVNTLIHLLEAIRDYSEEMKLESVKNEVYRGLNVQTDSDNIDVSVHITEGGEVDMSVKEGENEAGEVKTTKEENIGHDESEQGCDQIFDRPTEG